MSKSFTGEKPVSWKRRIKKWSLWLMAAFYFMAGVNHFVNPDFYTGLVPPYLPDPYFIVIISGIIEIVLAMGLLFSATRRVAVYGIILMLIAFIPAHVHHIMEGGCVSEQICSPLWMAWVRLVVFQPLLILWVWWYRDI